MTHKYKLRETVRLVRASYADERMAGSHTYEVIRLMPADQTGEPAYRIRSGHVERAVREGEMQQI